MNKYDTLINEVVYNAPLSFREAWHSRRTSSQDDLRTASSPSNRASSLFLKTIYPIPPASSSISSLKTPSPNNDNNNQTRDNQRPSHNTNNNDTAPRRRKLPTDDIMLTLKVSMKAEEKDQNADAQERCAEGLAHLSQVAVDHGLVGLGVCGRGRVDRGVEAEELGYCYSDRGEGEGGAQPG